MSSDAATARARPRGSERLISLATLALLFLLWTVLSESRAVNPIFLPTPTDVWRAFHDALVTGYQGSQLHEHIAASLKRVLSGYAIACVIGIPLGLLMSWMLIDVINRRAFGWSMEIIVDPAVLWQALLLSAR